MMLTHKYSKTNKPWIQYINDEKNPLHIKHSSVKTPTLRISLNRKVNTWHNLDCYKAFVEYK